MLFFLNLKLVFAYFKVEFFYQKEQKFALMNGEKALIKQDNSIDSFCPWLTQNGSAMIYLYNSSETWPRQWHDIFIDHTI